MTTIVASSTDTPRGAALRREASLWVRARRYGRSSAGSRRGPLEETLDESGRAPYGPGVRAAVLVAAAACLAMPACGGSDPNRGNLSELASPSTSATGSARADQPPTPAPSSAVAPEPGASAAPLEVTRTSVEGRQGRTAWSMDLPQVAGPLGPEVERRVRRSADEGVSRFATDAPDDVDSSVEVTAKVTRNDARTMQVQLDVFFYAQGTPHPSNSVSTVVLRRKDAAPVLLTDVLRDTTPALEAALRHASGTAAAEGREDPVGSLSTGVEDWADWQASPDGMTFLFDDYQAGSYVAGLREVDVPWSVVRPWVRDEAYRLLGPA